MNGWRASWGKAAVLHVKQLEKIIEQRLVLSIDRLEVMAGETVVVLGPPGSGKTLLIRILSGDLIPSGGSILLDGKDIERFPESRDRIGVLFDQDLLYERQTAVKNLEFFCRLRGVPASQVRQALTAVGLSDQVDQRPSNLSANNQRRLAFARLLIGKPTLWLLDQPALRTDLDTQALFERLIRQAAAQGTAVLLTDEDLSWAGKFCSRAVELESGHITNDYELLAGQGRSTPEHFVPYKVPARKEDRVFLFDPGEILYATSRDGKTYLRTSAQEAFTNLNLQELETRLAGRGFFKAHRAYLVNLQHIKAVIQFTRNSYSLQMDDEAGTMVPLSKQSEKELRDLLGY